MRPRQPQMQLDWASRGSARGAATRKLIRRRRRLNRLTRRLQSEGGATTKSISKHRQLIYLYVGEPMARLVKLATLVAAVSAAVGMGAQLVPNASGAVRPNPLWDLRKREL